MTDRDRNSFADRRKDAEAAKQRLLKKFEMSPKADDPAVIAKRAEREAVAKARTERRAESERLRREEQERQRLEAAALVEAAEAAANAESEARKAAEASRIARVISDEAERKAERDRRYAARKARQR